MVFVAGEDHVLFSPGVYTLRSASGNGVGKSLAFRSQNKSLEHIAFGSSVTGVFSGLGLSSWAFAGTLAVGAAAAATLALTLVVSGGAAVAGVALAIPLQRMLRSNALVLSSKRALRWQLEPSDDATNAFTLKVEAFEGDMQSGCFLNAKNTKQVKLNQDIGMSFVAMRAGKSRTKVFIKALERDGEKWLVGKTKKVILSSRKKSKWLFIKKDPLHQIV